MDHSRVVVWTLFPYSFTCDDQMMFVDFRPFIPLANVFVSHCHIVIYLLVYHMFQRAKFFTVRAGSKYLKLSKKSKIPMSLSAAKKHFRWMHLNETSTVFLFILWDWPKLFPSYLWVVLSVFCAVILFSFSFTGNHQMMFHDFRLLFPHLNVFVS